MPKKTTLKIIDKYRADHLGPFCTRDGRPVRLLTKTEGSEELPIVGFVGKDKSATSWDGEGRFFGRAHIDTLDLMCAREVPVPREFWVNEYSHGLGKEQFATARGAADFSVVGCLGQRLFREVLPGEGA